MENNAPQKKQLPAFLILTIIAVVAAVVLALTNQITAGPIAEHAMAALKDAFNAVMPAESYEEMTVPAGHEVSSLYAAKNGGEVIGYCVTASSNGYGGPVAVTLGVDTEGVVTGISVGDANFAETPGFGMRAKDASFQDQFPGISAIDGGAFEALSGATITSEAVRAATNKGLKCVAEVALGQTMNADVVFGAPAGKPAAKEEPAAQPEGDVITAAAPGFAGQDVGVSATLNADGTIATLSFDMSKQAPPVCDMCDTDDFKAQFIGKTGPFTKGENVDIVTGATYTSEGIIAAVNQILESAKAPAGDSRTAAAPGFAGQDVGVTAVMNPDNTIAELTFDMSKQVPPVCDMCDTDDFKAQFIGKTGPFTKGENVDIVTGATYTSEGIIAAVNMLFETAETFAEVPATVIAEGENATLAVKADGAAIVTPAEGYTGEVDVKFAVEDGKVTAGEFQAVGAEPAPADNIIGTAQGFLSEVNVAITLAEDGTIAALSIGSADETPGFGTRCAEDEAFINQFVGKKGPFAIGEGIDALSGATVTSEAVVKAINAAMGADVQVEEAPADATAAATAAATGAAEEVKVEEAAPAGEELVGKYQGFQSEVAVTLTVADGVITAIKVDSAGETNGFGTRCGEDEAFLNQFIGKKATPDLGEGIDVLSGATVTSEAVVKAANAAIGVDVAVEEAPADATAAATAAATGTTEEVKVEETAPAAAPLTAAAPGFAGKDVGVTATLNEDGTIATLTFDMSQQVPPVCDLCDTEDFKAQFIGKKGPFVKGEGVDIVTGATFTSEGIINAVNSLFAAEEVAVEEAPADVTAAATAAATATTEEVKAEEAAPAADGLTAVAPGFLDSEVGVTVTLNEDGTIATLAFDLSKQVPPVCDLCDTENFKAQFIGKKGPFVKGEGVDIVTGATFTSEGIIEALNKLFQ